MRVQLKGVHAVKVRDATGNVTAVYRYHRASKVRLESDPDTPAFVAELAKAETDWQAQVGSRAQRKDTLAQFICEYRASLAYRDLAERTRADYDGHIAAIDKRFGAAPLTAFTDSRIRAKVIDWRDGLAEKSRKQADYALTVLVRVLNQAVHRGRIDRHRIDDIERLYSADRSEAIWSAEQIEAVTKAAPANLRLALAVALHTGLRQGDLLRLPWNAWDGATLTVRTRKRDRVVKLRALPSLRSALTSAPRRALQVLVDGDGAPWKPSSFRQAWRRAVERAGLGAAGLTFHDLRGTAVTHVFETGVTTAEAAALFGVSIKTADVWAETYMARSRLSEAAVVKLERADRERGL